MANEINGGGNHELSTDINVITAEINAYQRVAGEAIFEIGRRLKHVKENDLAHGQWSKWCESIGMSRQQADRFIIVFDELGANDTTSCQIGLSRLYEIATLPPEQRDQPHTIPSTGETKTVDEMTVRELREVKKALKEAEKQAEIERRERERLEEENELLSNKPPKIETVYPDDYERLRQENRVYKRRYGDGNVRVVDAKEREKMYRDFANELENIRVKYASIALEGGTVDDYAKKDIEYARKINNFDEFWKQYAKSIYSGQTIIEMESV